ncbi:MAG: hypothetical protein LBI02_02250 [Opitutaceae bacterium]|jgi:hypothetical protein|nr:hypothetical protein [Opitutaceae bacterium]
MKITTPCNALVLACLFLAGSLGLARAADGSIGYFDTVKNDPFPETGKEYYLRHNIMYERDAWDSTNYWRGTLAAVNTKVRLLGLGGRKLVVQLADEGVIINVSVSRHTKQPLNELARALLAPKPVPVEKYSAEMQEAIKAGMPKTGMTKEQVVIARGYPPAHKTPSLKSSSWLYWNSKFVTHRFAFTDDVLTAARGVE